MATSPFKLNESTGCYTAAKPLTERDILEQARHILDQRFSRGPVVSDPKAAREYVMLQLADLEHEVFACLFLDNRHRVLAWESMFRGTIDSASVHPREVVKTALRHNAAAVILTHNHPSGIPEPSNSDQAITRRLVDSLALIDVRVLDHLVVGGSEITSMAERGLL